MRLAHYSDIHVTARPRLEGLASKRLAGALNYYVGARRARFEGVEHRIERLLADIDGQGVDHAICTGDLTAMSYEAEFERCASLFGRRLELPSRYTVLPGNHDRYTRAAVASRHFERLFGALASPSGSYPFKKSIAPGVTVVVVDVSRPASLLDSSGLCGALQRDELLRLLVAEDLADEFVILALHYGLLRPSGRPDRRSHGIRDWRSLVEVIESRDVHLDLVLHGHMHRAFSIQIADRPIHCAGSATDLHHACGYNIYDIDVQARSFAFERRVWSSDADSYVLAS